MKTEGMNKERKNQINIEISWLKNELQTKKLSQANRKEYLHQIKRKELEIAFS